MSSLLRLVKTVRGSSNRTTDEHLSKLVEIAEADPQDIGAQTVAAYDAWLNGKHDVALRLAQRADHSGAGALPALLVLTAIHAAGDDESKTYAYARRLASADRFPDKVALSVIRVLAGSRLLGSGNRSADLQHSNEVEKAVDDWVAWSKEFVAAYESRPSDA